MGGVLHSAVGHEFSIVLIIAKNETGAHSDAGTSTAIDIQN